MMFLPSVPTFDNKGNNTRATTAQQQQRRQLLLLLLLPLSWAEASVSVCETTAHAYSSRSPSASPTLLLCLSLPSLLPSPASAPLPVLLSLLDSFVLVQFYWISFCCCCDLSRILCPLSLFISLSLSFAVCVLWLFNVFFSLFVSLFWFQFACRQCAVAAAAAAAVSVCGFDSFSHFIYFHFHFHPSTPSVQHVAGSG